jgi:hypothetical protein
MSMKTNEVNIADNFFGLLKNLSSDVKLDLISKISESMKGNKPGGRDNSWKKLYGAFESNQSADEIIEEIRSSRYTNRDIEEL